MDKKTILNQTHRDMGARMVPFGGWDMPVHYGSQIEEHHAVRRNAGMFDVCHMTVVDLHGPDAKKFLSWLLANDVGKLKTPGKALYSCMLYKNGCVIDDLIVYYVNDDWYRMVVNAATTDKDIAWMQEQSGDYEVKIQPRRDLGMIAVQGPGARDKALPLLPNDLQEQAAQLEPFSACTNGEWFVGRTGYTGEDGFEIMLPQEQVVDLWKALADAGVRPCGLGARDTLRLEAGMNLYGQDMDEDHTPLESGLAWTVSFADLRDFIGRSALVVQKNMGDTPHFTGLVLEGKGVLRNHQKLYAGEREVGEITSGGYSPTLEKSIGLARIAADAGDELQVDIRGRRLPVKRVKPPFVRNGKPLI
ncbi:glycine cleavage system aminomethyltransferase GcvT [Thiolapillus brandeum]|uniref:Aminomethyltransferase n=1 Tax=Thiolapillus brandeum TaxID=1076588 RepID=A0A7U6GGA4_9GAMM|nr:glycine cleavage system aminomethyltransferase GcvT [Thiolapillus brandeum]BAO43083.1 glycine cleavage system aminomethyltransferase T [Thiolapillus brandeum]